MKQTTVWRWKIVFWDDIPETMSSTVTKYATYKYVEAINGYKAVRKAKVELNVSPERIISVRKLYEVPSHLYL